MGWNKYAGNCIECGQRVEAQQGILAKQDGAWVVRHGDCTASPVAPKPEPEKFAPTEEQWAAFELFATGESMVIEAGAGTGKTSTLRLLANSTQRKGRYIAFNKSIVADVSGSLPSNVTASTAHALAYKAVVTGTPFAERIKVSSRMKSADIARRLNIDYFSTADKTLSPSYLAGLVLRSISKFCQSADDAPTTRHVPYVEGLDEPGPRGARKYDNNKLLARHLLPSVRKAWKDLSDPKGTLPFKHDHYLKLWQLSHPKLSGDFILFDEAQDANPVLVAIVGEQTHLQRVYVGDTNQSIYEFTGAVNALATIDTPNRCFLTQSFRFGPAVAAAANEILNELGSELLLTGFDKIDSTVGDFEGDPDAVLTRTNAAAVDCILNAQSRGVSAHLVGGGEEVLRFARAAQQLQEEGFTSHPELSCFRSWDEVEEYVKDDEQGDELKLNVDLIKKYGIPTIITALSDMPREADAALVISTAHKSKGREWDSVRLAGDFVKAKKPGEDAQPPSPSELRLRYVAVTRAKLRLDNTVLTNTNNNEVAA